LIIAAECEVCHVRPDIEGTAIYRANAFGVDSIFRCEMHMADNTIDPELLELVHIIEDDTVDMRNHTRK
jgi:hypothetical protein